MPDERSAVGSMEFQILDADYVLVDEKPIIRLFGKTMEGKSVCAFHTGFYPYFYVDDPGALKVLEGEPQVKKIETVKRKLVHEPLKEREIFKITLQNPAKTPEIRQKVVNAGFKCYEADILFKYRFMNDLGLGGMEWARIENGVGTTTGTVSAEHKVEATNIKPVDVLGNAPLKVLAFDIECVPIRPGTAPEAKTDPVVMISMVFSEPHNGNNSHVFSIKPSEGVVGFESEKEMLERFIRVINEFDPDVLTGYNVNGFDFPYILERMNKHHIRPVFGRCRQKRVTSMKIGTFNRTNIAGRIIVDSFSIIKKDFSLQRYGLDFVAEKLLGEKKGEVKKSEIEKLWRGPPEGYKKLVEYSLQDSVLAMNLYTKLNLIDKYVALAKVSGIVLQDVLQGGEATRIENYLLREFNKEGYAFPIKPSQEEISKRDNRKKAELGGGFVIEPIKGLHKNVIVLDFKSMYPTIIRSYNICPTTILYGKEAEECKDCTKAPSGGVFLPQERKRGIVPQILEELMRRRGEAKKQLAKTRDKQKSRALFAKQWALKIMANAFYGYLGYSRAKIYGLDMANAITSIGRNCIKGTKDTVEKKYGYRIVYGDSITKERFVTLLNPQGIVEVKNISMFFNEFRPKRVKTNDGKERVLTPGYKALTVDPSTLEPKWAEINEVIRHKSGKKIFRVNQKFGETRVTEDHSIMVTGDNRLEEARPQDVGNREIARVSSVPEVKEVHEIDLYEIMKEERFKVTYKGHEKWMEVKDHGDTLSFSWTNRRNPVKVKRHIAVGSPEFAALCKLMGAYIAEGSSSTPFTTTSRLGASISTQDREWLEELQGAYEMLFSNSKTSIIRSAHGARTINTSIGTVSYADTTLKLQMMNGLAAVFFSALCGQKSSGKRIPSFMYHVPRQFQEIMLKHMVKGDGFIETSPKYSEGYKEKNFRYTTKSLHLVSGLSLLLLQMGIKHTIRYREDKQAYRITTCTQHNSRLETKTKEEGYDGFVYDLSVRDSHMFVDSCGQILLHNTDSVMAEIPEKFPPETELAELEKIATKIVDDINKGLPGVMELEFEKVYKRFLPLTKKRYAAWKFEKKGDEWKESIETKGIETVRRDWCPLVGETMTELINILLKGDDPKEALRYFREVADNLVKGKIDVSKLVITKGISRSLHRYQGVQPHVELAKKLTARDPTDAPGIGDRVGYVITKGKGLLSKRTEDPDFAKEHGLELDSNYYIENQLLPPTERLFSGLGFSKSEMLGTGKQLGIFEAARRNGNGSEQKVLEKIPLQEVNGFICIKCNTHHRRPPLSGVCSCGGDLLFSTPKGPAKSACLN